MKYPALGLLAVIVVAMTILTSEILPRDPQSTPSAMDMRWLPLEIDEMVLEDYGAQGIRKRITAQSCRVSPRRLLFFQIKTINEVRLEGVVVQSYLYPNVTNKIELTTAP